MLNGKKKVKTKTTVQATIQLTISRATLSLATAPGLGRGPFARTCREECPAGARRGQAISAAHPALGHSLCRSEPVWGMDRAG